MKYVVFCLAVVLGVASAAPKWADYPCPDFCPQIFRPVCGSDGIETMTFSNECMMRAHGCRKSSKFFALRSGPCGEALASAHAVTRVHDCGACTMEYAPVCASNGEKMMTFGNKCSLNVYNCEHPMNAKFIMTRSGECDEEVPEPVKPNCGPCTREYNPVCASNGEKMMTFGNKCTLDVHNCENPTSAKFFMTRSGECDEEVPEPEAKPDCGACTMEYKPVCGSNGEKMKTFGNKCALNVHNCQNPKSAQYVMTHGGECGEEAVAPKATLSIASKIWNLIRNCGVCPLLYSPVCASNGANLMTFSNECSLRVYNCEHPLTAKFSMTRSGECEQEVEEPVAEPKPRCGPCTFIYAPVCASNGETEQTFGNKCTLDAHNCENPNSAKFVMTRAGEC